MRSHSCKLLHYVACNSSTASSVQYCKRILLLACSQDIPEGYRALMIVAGLGIVATFSLD